MEHKKDMIFSKLTSLTGSIRFKRPMFDALGPANRILGIYPIDNSMKFISDDFYFRSSQLKQINTQSSLDNL